MAPLPSALRLPRPHARRSMRQRGAALLVALLTVTLVATFAAAALWQQWRATEVEAAERARLQSAWVLVSALDWARLILREDALNDARLKAGASATGVVGSSHKRPADHLGEPWAIPLAEVQLRAFLSAEQNVAADQLDDLPQAYLSGRIVDASSKLNVRNLVANGQPSEPAVRAFQKLFAILSLPQEQVTTLVRGLQRVWPAAPGKDTEGDAGAGPQAGRSDADVPLTPSRLEDLVWVGLPASTLEALKPYATVLPAAAPTKVNINTASAEVLAASSEKLDLAGAQRLVEQRQREYFDTLEMANALLPNLDAPLSSALHGVDTQYFEVHGRLRLDRLWVEEHSLLQRNGATLQVLWRDRGAGTETRRP
ncbi:type II secretion system minor pseudopilin GspK [Xenophilus sp. Marseille-Q4582]|uniref:type II secretion system minor pseudopilin GspK n=1 Tax=Xenophilus sp. Marseille-Q4582 TaxID=2866600 RepID=UPI001CE4935D|nr:type II secretion system minor pseudopilin GspK [Xenophilus sp. Marseille-Q4582]